MMLLDIKKPVTAIVLAFVACILWSGNFVMARGVHDFINPIGFAFWRWFIAFWVMAFIARKNIKTSLPLLKRDIKLISFMGITSVGIYNTLVYKAGHFTSANSIALLAATSPIWTMLLAGLLKWEELNIYKSIGVAIAFLGATNVILKGDIETLKTLHFNFGDILMLIASFIWAIYSLLLKKRSPDMPASFFLLAIIFFGLMVLTPLYVLEIMYVGVTPFTPKVVGAYLYVAICASVIAWFFFNNAVSVIGAIRTSVIYYSMPIFTGALSVFVLNEHFYRYHIIGFLLVLAGIIVSNIRINTK